MADGKKNVSMRLNADAADRLNELLEAYKADGRGDRAEAFDMLMPHIEYAFAADVAPAINEDVRVIRSAAAAITSRMDAIARAYSMIEEVAQAGYRDTLSEQAAEIRDLKRAASEAEEAHAALVAGLRERIGALEGELSGARAELEEARKRAAEADSERRAWNDERDAMTAQMRAVTEKLLAR